MPTQTLSELDALVAKEFAAISNLIEAKLVPLMVRKQLATMAGLDLAPLPVPVPRPGPPAPVATRTAKPMVRRGRPPGRKAAPTTRPPRMKLPRGMAAHVILKALSTAPAEGMHGRDLNALILGAGLTIDTAEKSKTFLRHWGLLDHDVITGLWSFKPVVRHAFPDLSELVPAAPAKSAKSPRDMREHGVGRLVMEALSAGPPEGTPSPSLYATVQSRDYSFSSVKKALNGLRIAGHIETRDRHGETTWRIVPQDGATGTGNPQETAR